MANVANVANCRVNFAICEAALAAMRAITTNPDESEVVEKHNEACGDAYGELEAAYHHAESAFKYGTEEEWEALSDDRKASEWDRFHYQCAQGVGDEMYFYPVLMKWWLVGYVGH